MPAIAIRSTVTPGVATDKTFPIVFAVVAFLIITACIIWGYYIPKWRQKYPRPSSTIFNTIRGTTKTSTPPKHTPRFPSHTAVIRKHQSRELPRYDPYHESPFPSKSYAHTSISLSNVSTSNNHAGISSENIKPQTPPPVALRAGRHPLPTKRKSMAPSSTNLVNGEGQLSPVPEGLSLGSNAMTTEATKENTRKPFPGEDTNCNTNSLPKVNKRSLKPAMLHASKPKIAEIRDRYDRVVGGAKFRPPSQPKLRKQSTPSTEPLTGISTSTSDLSYNNSPISAEPPSPCPSLVPTPLRLPRKTKMASSPAILPKRFETRDRSHWSQSDHPRLSSSQQLPIALRRTLRSKRHARKSTGFYHPSVTSSTKKLGFKAYQLDAPDHEIDRDGKSSTTSIISRVSMPKVPSLQRSSRTGNSIDRREITKATTLLESNPDDYDAYWNRSVMPGAELGPSTTRLIDQVNAIPNGRNLDTTNWDLASPQMTRIKRSWSALGPSSVVIVHHTESPELFTPSPIHEPFVFQLSDDVFGDDKEIQVIRKVEVLKRVIEMEMAASQPGLNIHIDKKAPGGADWV